MRTSRIFELVPAEDLPPGEAVIHKFLHSRGTLEVNTSTGAAIMVASAIMYCHCGASLLR